MYNFKKVQKFFLNKTLSQSLGLRLSVSRVRVVRCVVVVVVLAHLLNLGWQAWLPGGRRFHARPAHLLRVGRSGGPAAARGRHTYLLRIQFVEPLLVLGQLQARVKPRLCAGLLASRVARQPVHCRRVVVGQQSFVIHVMDLAEVGLVAGRARRLRQLPVHPVARRI